MIVNLSRYTRDEIKEVVSQAVRYWPNSHLGTNTRRQDMHSAFKMIRVHTEHSDIQTAIGRVYDSAAAHVDM